MTDGTEISLHSSQSWIRIALPVAVIILVGLHWWQTKTLRLEAESASAMAREQWSNHPPAFPLDSLSNSVYAPLAVSPIAVFDAGDGPWLGSTLWLQLGRLARSQDQIGYDYFPAGRRADLSAATLIQLVIPMLAILIWWQGRNAKKGQGGRNWANLILQLTEICGPAVAVGCLLVGALFWHELGANGAIRLILILACYLLFIVSVGSLCWLVTRFCRDQSIATLLLTLFWLFNFTLARPATLNIAATLYPLPTLDAFARKIDFETRSGYNGVEPRRDRERRFIAEALADYKVKTIEQMPVNLSAILLQKEERHQREVFVRRIGELRSQFEGQERVEQIVSLLLPSTAIQIASSALAATDAASEREQLAQADLYWDRIVKKVYDDIVQSSGTQGNKIPRGPEYWRQFPFVNPVIPDPTHSIVSALIPVAGLSLWAAIGIFFAARRSQPIPPSGDFA